MIVHKEKLSELATKLIAYAKAHAHHKASIFALTGDLGAGKTTLVQHVARALGVVVEVPSPTFVIMRIYQTKDAVFTRLVHIDAYRIEEPSELGVLRLDELFADPHTLICIEWPEKLQDRLPSWALPLSLKPVGEHEREISIHGSTEPFNE